MGISTTGEVRMLSNAARPVCILGAILSVHHESGKMLCMVYRLVKARLLYKVVRRVFGASVSMKRAAMGVLGRDKACLVADTNAGAKVVGEE